jgi:hypothetical protein
MLHRERMRKRPPRQAEPPFDGSIESFRKFLGPFGDNFTDAQLPALRRDMQVAASLLLDLYLLERAGKLRSSIADSNGFDSDGTVP